jgi:hypothetical protein
VFCFCFTAVQNPPLYSTRLSGVTNVDEPSINSTKTTNTTSHILHPTSNTNSNLKPTFPFDYRKYAIRPFPLDTSQLTSDPQMHQTKYSEIATTVSSTSPFIPNHPTNPTPPTCLKQVLPSLNPATNPATKTVNPPINVPVNPSIKPPIGGSVRNPPVTSPINTAAKINVTTTGTPANSKPIPLETPNPPPSDAHTNPLTNTQIKIQSNLSNPASTSPYFSVPTKPAQLTPFYTTSKAKGMNNARFTSRFPTENNFPPIPTAHTNSVTASNAPTTRPTQPPTNVPPSVLTKQSNAPTQLKPPTSFRYANISSTFKQNSNNSTIPSNTTSPSIRTSPAYANSNGVTNFHDNFANSTTATTSSHNSMNGAKRTLEQMSATYTNPLPKNNQATNVHTHHLFNPPLDHLRTSTPNVPNYTPLANLPLRQQTNPSAINSITYRHPQLNNPVLSAPPIPHKPNNDSLNTTTTSTSSSDANSTTDTSNGSSVTSDNPIVFPPLPHVQFPPNLNSIGFSLRSCVGLPFLVKIVHSEHSIQFFTEWASKTAFAWCLMYTSSITAKNPGLLVPLLTRSFPSL